MYRVKIDYDDGEFQVTGPDGRLHVCPFTETGGEVKGDSRIIKAAVRMWDGKCEEFTMTHADVMAHGGPQFPWHK